MRKWTTSACVVLAWCLLPLIAAAGLREPEHPTQANTSIASSTQVTLTSESATVKKTPASPVAAEPATWTVRPGDTLSAVATALTVPGGWQALYAANRQAIGPNPNLISPGTVLALPGTEKPTRYTVAPGNTLSAIATALMVPGGWQALYAANRQAIGPNPNVIRPGTVLTAPRPTSAQARPGHMTRSAPVGDQHSPQPRHPTPTPANGHQAPAPASDRSPSHLTAIASGMPRWLEDILIAAGVLIATAFIAEPATVLARRRMAARSRPGSAADKAQIIRADHERLIVAYSTRDHAVYIFTPPGEDPKSVLRAARLVVPEHVYQQLADHLGIPATWPIE